MSDQLYFEDIQKGMALPTLEKCPTTRQLVMYAGASNDYYEIHYDAEFARERGLEKVIVHGALKSAFLGQLITDWIGGRGTLKKLAVQYRGMDVPGDRLTCMGTVTKKIVDEVEGIVECDIWIENGSGRRTTQGTAIVVLPLRNAES